MYDFIIVGADPVGIVAVWILPRDKKILLVDEYGLDGCHRVD